MHLLEKKIGKREIMEEDGVWQIVEEDDMIENWMPVLIVENGCGGFL